MLVLWCLIQLIFSFITLVLCCWLGGPIGFLGWCIMMAVSSICQVLMYTTCLKLQGVK